ncbi:hypothetical protein PRUPE_8G014100 [Prunus persica]|uniref:Flavin-containing monooxygenase n=1 Tax=Prunus persica TaxID=3760 RepID=M5VV62_PRUPE|nr:probable indole-3-pyruvate monooxygenase YUCCA10 [Prunus persica]ONH89754.1 hypothetical protein PRUPE_8G014100 [Prunus persica]
MEQVDVVIVGAGPAGIATSACLNRLNISNVVLEREDCYASLWKKRSYDRLKLHLAKQFCELPHMPFPPNAPKYVPKDQFVEYLDSYVSHFKIQPLYHRVVETAFYDADVEKWHVIVKNTSLDAQEIYLGKFLVVASGENSEGYIPQVQGLDSFGGEFMHSSKYENGKKYSGKNVLVVGCGNSGMEIAYDLSNSGANTSIVVRSPIHVLTKEIVFLGMVMAKYIPINLVDNVMVILSKLRFGDLSKYGIRRPKSGPFFLKEKGQAPIIDVGSVNKIRTGELKVVPSITSIQGDNIEFENGCKDRFDAIVFATGYKSTVLNWLKDGHNLFNDDGMPKQSFPNNWKGKNGLYCAGFSRRGLFGISHDARMIISDISFALDQNKKKS